MSETSASGGERLAQLVAALLGELEGTAVTECEFHGGEHRVLIRRAPSFVPAAAAQVIAEPEGVPAHWRPLPAPLPGIFYAAESPQQPPLVSVGMAISVGQTVGLIEAMKMFNRVESTFSGVVRAILVANAAEVRAGEPLLYVEPAGEIS